MISIAWERGFKRIAIAVWLVGVLPAALLGASFAYDNWASQISFLPEHDNRVPLWSPRMLIHPENMDLSVMTLRLMQLRGKETPGCIEFDKRHRAWQAQCVPLYRTAFYWKAWGITLGAPLLTAAVWSGLTWGIFWGIFYSLRWIIKGFL